MPVRLKWEIDAKDVDYRNNFSNRDQIIDLIDNNHLTSYFQPIFSIKEACIFGFEALARVTQEGLFHSTHELFQSAKEFNVHTKLDIACCSNAAREAALQGITRNMNHLFINISPATICDPSYCVSITNEIIHQWGLIRDMVVFEITEESMASNCDNFKETIRLYKHAGYKIAIDDFGAGYGGLKMLSQIEPDFIKIDRHFITNIDKAIVKYNLVDSIVIACHRMGIRVVAEGIERVEELDIVSNMGIDLCQGFYLCKPQPLIECEPFVIKDFQDKAKTKLSTGNRVDLNAETKCIGDIAVRINPISSDMPVKSVLNSFIEDPNLRCQPVVDDERITGIIYRTRFIENQVVGKCGYGMHLNFHKMIKQIMDTRFLIVEANEPLESVSKRVQKRKPEHLYDEIAVTKNGKYHGIVSINMLLEAITQKSLALAKGANPLTGLPGNEAIQRQVEDRITQRIHFDVAYFDLNNFKPYNDYYGFERGDYVIRTLADIMTRVTENSTKDNTFIGHIGGDDFIMITHPSISIATCNRIIALFEQMQPNFHGRDDYKSGFYTATNRKGEKESFGLLTISVGIISTEVYKINSFAELASIATEVKKAAKIESTRLGKSAIVRDRRLFG